MKFSSSIALALGMTVGSSKAKQLYPDIPSQDPSSSASCVISDEESCPISAMPRDESTLVYPGGETRCIFSTSTDFAFQVIPGDMDKVLLFFQGGGACWSKDTTTLEFCTTDIKPANLNGVFDRTNPANPYLNYTIVHVLYCSGDLHGGNVTRPYNDSQGVPVQQKGYYNTQSAVDWINANFDAQLDQLMMSGCSAGSLGVQAWATTLIEELDAANIGVVADSYAGVFPEGTQGPLVYEYGMCGLGLLTGALEDACNAETVTVQDVFNDAIQKHPNIGFANINSKADDVQMSFYAAVAASFETLPLALTPADYEDAVNVIFEEYNQNPNYVSYLVTGTQHCYLPSGITYTADTTGTTGGGQGGQMTLVDWMHGFPTQVGQTVNTQCDGEELNEDQWDGYQYCDAEQQGKTYTREY